MEAFYKKLLEIRFRLKVLEIFNLEVWVKANDGSEKFSLQTKNDRNMFRKRSIELFAPHNDLFMYYI